MKLKNMKSFCLSLSIILLCSCKSVKNEASKNNESIIEIASERVDCVGVAPQKCLQIKEDGKPNWEFFYDVIEGFNFTEGFHYKLKIRKEKVENPPADSSSIKYILVEVISSEAKEATNIFNKYPLLTVTKIEYKNDAYVAHLIDKYKMNYTMYVSESNLKNKYLSLNVGDKIKANGFYAESIPIQINVKQIKVIE